MTDPDYSKHLTPDDWGDPTPTRIGVNIGLVILVFIFLCGVAFDHWLLMGRFPW